MYTHHDFARFSAENSVLMGTFVYDSALSADFEDRLLAHLQIIICAKLRRNESFHFSWKDEDAGAKEGRSVIWLNPAIPLSFRFFASRPPAINRLWIDELMLQANSPGGLQITPEPADGDTGQPQA